MSTLAPFPERPRPCRIEPEPRRSRLLRTALSASGPALWIVAVLFGACCAAISFGALIFFATGIITP